MPTPAVAYLTRSLGADLGVMLSAIHNPAPDNGIKFFGRGGHKLADEIEDAIEAATLGEDLGRPVGAGVGRVRDAHGEVEQLHRAPAVDAARARLDGLRVVVDCAHGAASASPRGAAPRRRRGDRDRRRRRTA